MSDQEKLALIATIVAKQTDAQNGEPGSDSYQADAYLALEAIDIILSGASDYLTNGAVRTFLGGK